MENPTDVLSLIPESAFVKKSGKFQPKLSFDDQCSVLAFVLKGVSRPLVAQAFGIDRRTVGHIVNMTGIKYHNVRKRLKALGPDDFAAEYLTESWAMKIAEAARNATDHEQDVALANRRAASHAGIHMVKPDQCRTTHRIEIAFLERQGDQPGWHYRDLDSSTPDLWFHNGEVSLRSSKACLDAVMENLVED